MAETVNITIKAIDQASGVLRDLKNGFESFTGISLSAAGAIAAVTAALKFSVDAASDAEQVDTRLEATLKATGNAAGLTADEIDDLATQYSRLTSQEDESIKSAATVLLRFQSLNQETFPRALEATLNLSAAMGTDLSSAAMQLGRALESPTDGLGALRRAGIVFTDAQKDLIKSLAEAGDMAGAQAVIFDALDQRIGGVAEAMAGTYKGQLDAFKNEIGNIGETIGNVFLPPLTAAVKGLNWLFTATDRVNDAVAEANVSVAKSAATYEEYVKQVVENVKATGQGTFATYAYAEAQEDVLATLEGMGIKFEYLTWLEYQRVRSAEQQKTATRNLSDEENDRIKDLDDLTEATKDAAEETGNLYRVTQDAVHTSRTLFDGFNTDVRSPIAEFVEDLQFLSAGGMQILFDFSRVKASLAAGAITMEEAEEMLKPVEVAYEKLLVTVGQQTQREAIKNIMETLDLTYQQAYTLYSGASTTTGGGTMGAGAAGQGAATGTTIYQTNTYNNVGPTPQQLLENALALAGAT